jgi:periplasmic divalent cation tolerance protein
VTASPHGESPDRPTLVELRTTFPDRDTAVACAERLVRDGVAACVQVDGPVASVYAWRGAVERAEEWRCTCKTSPGRAAACRAAITAGHPYDVPELIETVVAGTAAYAAWVRDSVGET